MGDFFKEKKQESEWIMGVTVEWVQSFSHTSEKISGDGRW